MIFRLLKETRKGEGMAKRMTGYKNLFIAIIVSISIIGTASIISCKSEETSETQKSPTQLAQTTRTMLPLTRVSTEDFTGSGNCANCHTGLSDTAGNDVSIGSHWRSTMMANAAKDPIWQAKVASEVSRTPGLKAVIEDKCTTCHMPMAYTQANADGTPALILDDGFLNPSNPLHEIAMDGNSCTLCHQIVDPVLGKYTIDTSTEPPDRLNYGPFTNPQQMAMRNGSGFTPVFGEQTLESTLCGTCH
jgi:hypothetical protein